MFVKPHDKLKPKTHILCQIPPTSARDFLSQKFVLLIQIETVTPDALAERYFSGVRYDLIVSYSSLEHSGLGR